MLFSSGRAHAPQLTKVVGCKPRKNPEMTLEQCLDDYREANIAVKSNGLPCWGCQEGCRRRAAYAGDEVPEEKPAPPPRKQRQMPPAPKSELTDYDWLLLRNPGLVRALDSLFDNAFKKPYRRRRG